MNGNSPISVFIPPTILLCTVAFTLLVVIKTKNNNNNKKALAVLNIFATVCLPIEHRNRNDTMTSAMLEFYLNKNYQL